MASSTTIIAARIIKSNLPTLLQRQKVSRTMSTLTPKIKEAMGKIGMEDGTPIFIKTGAFDNIIYRGTMGVCVVSLGLIVTNFYLLSVKK